MITEQQELKILEEASKRGISFSEMLRKIIDLFLEKKDNTGGDSPVT